MDNTYYTLCIDGERAIAKIMDIVETFGNDDFIDSLYANESFKLHEKLFCKYCIAKIERFCRKNRIKFDIHESTETEIG